MLRVCTGRFTKNITTFRSICTTITDVILLNFFRMIPFFCRVIKGNGFRPPYLLLDFALNKIEGALTIHLDFGLDLEDWESDTKLQGVHKRIQPWNYFFTSFTIILVFTYLCDPDCLWILLQDRVRMIFHFTSFRLPK